MGANNFSIVAVGKDAREAFDKAVKQAQYEYGHSGYTGTIAEKNEFVMITDTTQDVRVKLKREVEKARTEARRLKANKADKREIMEVEWDLEHKMQAKKHFKASEGAAAIARALDEIYDPRCMDKWGPCGCIELKGKAAREYKERHGLKGKQVKIYMFFGLASS